MNIQRYEPWNLFRLAGSERATAGWAPRVDVREETAQFTVAADLPGVDSKDIHVSAEDGVLTIKGERKFEKKEGSAGYERLERFEGSFQRQFVLPDNVNADEIKARHNNGVLEVSIPKQAQAVPRRINVDVN
jgi:HSP20 family protein